MAGRKLTRKEIREGLDSVPLDTILLGANTGDALTPSQREFARNLALGKSKAQSYREAYNSKGTPKTQAANGYKLAQRTDIEQIRSAYSLAIEAAKHRTPSQLREFVIHQLMQHALNDETNPAQRIKALELLGKTAEASLFEERKTVTTIKASEDIRGRLIEQLRTLTAGAVDAIPSGQAAPDADSAADSLLAELTAGGSNAPDSDPTAPPPAFFDGDAHGSSTYTIPHNQSAEISNQHISDSNDINDLPVSPEQVQVRIAEIDPDFEREIEGEGGQIPPGDWDVVDGEVVPHGN